MAVAVMPPHYELETYEKLIWACNCRTTLLMWRQVTHTCESHWSDPRLTSFIQGQEESGHSVHKGKKAEDKLDSKSNYTRVYIHFGCTS